MVLVGGVRLTDYIDIYAEDQLGYAQDAVYMVCTENIFPSPTWVGSGLDAV